MKGLLFMGLLGYAIGTMFAPKKGSELRKDIKDVIDNFQENGSDIILDAQSKASDLLDKAEPAMNQVKENAMSMKDKAMTLKENAMTMKENVAKSFNEGFAKEQAAAKQRKMETSNNFDPSNLSSSTASSF
jgi:gas vesicle protein